jgi:hypothetical protein
MSCVSTNGIGVIIAAAGDTRKRPWVGVDVPSEAITCGLLLQWSVVRSVSASALSFRPASRVANARRRRYLQARPLSAGSGRNGLHRFSQEACPGGHTSGPGGVRLGRGHPAPGRPGRGGPCAVPSRRGGLEEPYRRCVPGRLCARQTTTSTSGSAATCQLTTTETSATRSVTDLAASWIIEA